MWNLLQGIDTNDGEREEQHPTEEEKEREKEA